MKKSFSYWIASIAILTCSACGHSRLSTQSGQIGDADVDTLVGTAVNSQDAAVQEEASKKLEILLASFDIKKGQSASDNTFYPAYYGGAFIGANDQLVVYITENLDANKQYAIEHIGVDGVEYRSARYTYQTLTSLMDELNAYMNSKAKVPATADIVLYSLADMENRIIVQVVDWHDSKRKEFENTPFDHEAVVFRGTEGILVNESDH